MDDVFSFKKNIFGNNEMFSFEQITNCTNLRAICAGTGSGDTCHLDCKSFTIQDSCQHVGIYILHELSPSPQVELKMRPQWKLSLILLVPMQKDIIVILRNSSQCKTLQLII
jgi:hypothetical protein